MDLNGAKFIIDGLNKRMKAENKTSKVRKSKVKSLGVVPCKRLRAYGGVARKDEG